MTEPVSSKPEIPPTGWCSSCDFLQDAIATDDPSPDAPYICSRCGDRLIFAVDQRLESEVAQLREDNRNLNLGQVEWNKMWNELQADAHNLKSPVHAICNQNLTETLTAALEEKQRADKAESEAAQLRKNEAVFEKAIKDLRDDAQGTEMEKRLRGALMVAGIGEWTHWNAAIDLFVKAAQAQAHFARLAAERYDQLLEKDRTVAQLRAEVERLQGMLRDYIEQHNALRQQESESQLENRMLWNELTRALGATRVRALSEAILAARSQGAKEQGQ